MEYNELMTEMNRYGTVPPPPVTEAAKCELTLYHDSIYIAGAHTCCCRTTPLGRGADWEIPPYMATWQVDMPSTRVS